MRREDARYPALPHPRSGEQVLGRGTLGPITLLGILATRLDFVQALDAVLGWDGDTYTLIDSGGQLCVQLGILADTESDFDELLLALQDWAGDGPGAEVAQRGQMATMRACETGKVVRAAHPPSELLEALAARGTYLVEAVARVPDLRSATCVTDTTIRLLGRSSFVALVFGDEAAPGRPSEAQIDAVNSAARTACGL